MFGASLSFSFFVQPHSLNSYSNEERERREANRTNIIIESGGVFTTQRLRTIYTYVYTECQAGKLEIAGVRAALVHL